MKFDRNGRLIFSDDNPQVLSSTGGPPTVLFSTPSRPGDLAIDDENRIFLVLEDGTIRIYTPDGKPAGIFATGLAGLDTSLAFSDGGGFGKFLYVLSGSTLLRFDKKGKSTVIGTGFGIGMPTATGFVFGPDRALYVSDFPAQRILRISRGHGR
jgi:sugar lactone lactonase YvrE